MSIEKHLSENTAAMTALTAALAEHTEVMKAVAVNQEKLIAGQGAALEKIESSRAPKTTAGKGKETKTETKPKETKTETKPKETKTETTTGASAGTGEVTDETLKGVCTAYLNTAADAAAKKKLAAWLVDIVKSFGVYAEGEKPIITGNDSMLTPELRKRMSFLIRRANKLGGPDHVNLSAEYDLDGALDQPEPESASEEVVETESDDDLLG